MIAAFFDLDKTLISRTSSVAFADGLRRNGVMTRKQIARLAWVHLKFMRHSGPEQSMKLARLGLEMAKGWDQQKVQQLVDESLHRVINPLIYPRGVDLIAEHAKQGHLIVVISSSPMDVVLPVARHLGADTVIASQPDVDNTGRYTGTLQFFSYGQNKVRAMQELAMSMDVTLKESWAYSDSITDLPMMESVGNPVAVNPDRDLRSVAVAKGWTIESFIDPGKLKSQTRRVVSTAAFTVSAIDERLSPKAFDETPGHSSGPRGSREHS